MEAIDIINDWEGNKEVVSQLDIAAREALVPAMVLAFVNRKPNDELAKNLVSFIKSLPVNDAAVKAHWYNNTPPFKMGDLIVPGTSLVIAWDMVANCSLDHAIMLHKYIANVFVEMADRVMFMSK